MALVHLGTTSCTVYLKGSAAARPVLHFMWGDSFNHCEASRHFAQTYILSGPLPLNGAHMSHAGPNGAQSTRCYISPPVWNQPAFLIVLETGSRTFLSQWIYKPVLTYLLQTSVNVFVEMSPATVAYVALLGVDSVAYELTYCARRV